MRKGVSVGLACFVFFAAACLSAADPFFLRRHLSDVKPAADDLTANAKAASYKPLFGVGDADAGRLQGVALYVELTVGPGGTSLLSWLILYNSFLAAAHLIQNDIGGGLPDERLGLFVPGCEPRVNGALQFVD